MALIIWILCRNWAWIECSLQINRNQDLGQIHINIHLILNNAVQLDREVQIQSRTWLIRLMIKVQVAIYKYPTIRCLQTLSKTKTIISSSDKTALPYKSILHDQWVTQWQIKISFLKVEKCKEFISTKIKPVRWSLDLHPKVQRDYTID